VQAVATGGLGSPNKHFVNVRSQDGADASGSRANKNGRRPTAIVAWSCPTRLAVNASSVSRPDARQRQPYAAFLAARSASIGSMPLAVSALCSAAFERAAFRLRQDMTRTPTPHLGEAYLRTYLVRTAGLEPALSERNRFSYHFGFRRRQSAFVAWTVPSPWRLGRRRRPSSLYTFPQSRAWLGIGLGLEPVSVPRL